MKKQALGIVVLVGTFLLFGFDGIAQKKASPKKASPKKGTSSPLKTGIDSLSYAIGVNVGSNIRQQPGIKKINADVMALGLDKAFKGDSTSLLMSPEVAMSYIQKHMEKEFNSKKDENKRKGQTFLEANKSKAGVTTTASGLQYQVIKEGTGAKPGPEDEVMVSYKGSLLDGKVFDASPKDKPVEFALNQVIKGWTEALQLMKEGSTWQLWIPSELAYGQQGASGVIGPDETLSFEVSLLKVMKKPATPEVTTPEVVIPPATPEKKK